MLELSVTLLGIRSRDHDAPPPSLDHCWRAGARYRASFPGLRKRLPGIVCCACVRRQNIPDHVRRGNSGHGVNSDHATNNVSRKVSEALSCNSERKKLTLSQCT